MALAWVVGLPALGIGVCFIRAAAQLRALRDSGALANNTEVLATSSTGGIPNWVTAVPLPVVVFGPPGLLVLAWAWSQRRSPAG